MRGADIDQFFECENQAIPPAISENGKICRVDKATFLPCLEGLVEQKVQNPHADAKIIDGAVVVNMLKIANCHTYADYAESVFAPYILGQLHMPSPTTTQ